jgi:hypothetical protein
MFGSVEKDRYKPPMKIGIGTKEQHPHLSAYGCEKSFLVDELMFVAGDYGRNLDPVDMIFREEDTVVLLQPGVMPPELMEKICKVAPFWQVPGHDPIRLNSDDERASFRRQKARNMDVPLAADAHGRPPKWPVPTDAQVARIVALWHGPKKPAVILEIVQAMFGVDVPKHWVRDQVIKSTGSAKRSPQGELSNE